MGKKKTILYVIGILIAGGLVTSLIFLTEPEAQKSGATKKTAMLVETVEVKQGNFKPRFKATGNVRASRRLMLSPLVGGQIIKQSDAFIPGEIVKKGTLLLQIDPADYQNILELRYADLLQAESNYRLEKGRSKVAEQDYKLLEDSLQFENPDLVLREPQLKSAEANYKAAKAAYSQAKLDLERSSIKAPFHAQILSRNVNIGSQVSAGSNLGSLVGVEEYWVVVNLSLRKIPWLRFDNEGNKATKVIIRDKKAWKAGQSREGKLIKFIGSLEDQSRLARLIVSVKDPLGLKNDSTSNSPALIINSFVEVELFADELEDVVRLDRDNIRKNNTAWVMKAGKLSIRELEILIMDDRFAYVSNGLKDGEKVVTSSLATVANGALLREDSAETNVLKSNGERTHSR